jgi:hypothetical protein
MIVLGEREVQRNWLRAGSDFDGHAVVTQQQFELLAVIVSEDVGARQRGLEGARASDETVAQWRLGAHCRRGLHPHERIERAHAPNHRIGPHEVLQGAAQVCGAAFVDRPDLGKRTVRVVEPAGRNVGRRRIVRFAHGCQ